MIAFWRDQKGSVAITVALSAMVLIMIVGAVIDFGTAIYVRSNLQNAVDAAALAAGNADAVVDPLGNVIVPDTERVLLDVAQKMFNANNRVISLATARPLTLTYTPADRLQTDSVFLTATAVMPTNFLRLIGFDTLNITVQTRAQRPKPAPIDLALVLDTTLSMNDSPQPGEPSKISTLRTAATQLVAQLMTANNANDGRVRIGVVPYNNVVNVLNYPSPGNTVPDWTPDWVLPIERQFCATYGWEFPDGQCTRAYYDCLVDGVWKTDGCFRDTCTKGKRTCEGQTISKWNGCIGARSVISNNPADVSNNPSTDQFLATIWSPNNPPKYAGMWKVGGNCYSPKPILGLTGNKALVTTAIRGLVAGGNTHIPTGLIWGWNVLDPAEPYIARTWQELAQVGGRKYLLLMTDGVNATSPRLPLGDYLENGNTALSAAWRDGSKSDQLTREICQNIKNAGIEIFTVAFNVPEGEQIETILMGCASEPKDERYFKAENTQELLLAFKKIVESLSILKIVE